MKEVSMNLRGFFMVSVAACAAALAFSSCFIIRPVLVAIESPDVVDESVPKEELAYLHFDTGFIPVSCNGIPIDELSRYSDDDRSLFGSPASYHYLAIPSGTAGITGNISFSRSTGGFFTSGRKVYTARGAEFSFNFKPGGDYIIELVYEEADNSLGVAIFEGTKGYYYDDKTFRTQIMF
jgi:hypothetical protein